MQWDKEGIKRDLELVKRFCRRFICLLRDCAVKLSTWWRRSDCAVKAFLIVISCLLCLVPVVFLNWWWGKFSYSAAFAAIIGLATI